MKRVIRASVAICLMQAILFLLCACYIVSPARMRNIEGTYQLTTYSTSEDKIAARGMTLYMVIRSDGSGYYAFSDNDTELYYSDVKCRFTQDSERSGYYSYVEVDFGNGEWVNLGVNSNSKTLGSSVPKYKGNIFEGTLEVDYYTTVTFTRVSRIKDMRFINKQLGEVPYLCKDVG